MAITTNIVSDQELKEKMSETLEFLAHTLKNTLGPYGSTTIIQDQFMNHQITKDGYSLLKKIVIREKEAATVLDLVKAISRRLVRKVGDGSTSSIIIANSLYKEVTELMKKYKVPPKNLLSLLDQISTLTAEEIKLLATPIADDMSDLRYIAAVSTNNDLNYGLLIEEIFTKIGRYGFVDLQLSKTEKTYYEVTKGIEVGRGYLNTIMANQPDKKTCVIEDCNVLMVNDKLTEDDIDSFSDILGYYLLTHGQPLCIIAKGYDTAFEVFLHTNIKNVCRKGKAPDILAVDLAMNNIDNQNRVDDIAAFVGCEVFDKAEGWGSFSYNMVGKVNKVVCTDTYYRLIEGHGDKAIIDARVKQLTEELQEKSRREGHIEFDKDVYELRRRIAHLDASLAVLYIGGKSEDAKETDKYLVEDAVFACRSALEFGYIPGGNLIVPIVLTDSYEKILNQLINDNPKMKKEYIQDVLLAIKESFLQSYISVLNNCYMDLDYCRHVAEKCVDEHLFLNLKEDEMETMDETHIINSAETDIEILKASISIIGLLATSNQFIKFGALFNN